MTLSAPWTVKGVDHAQDAINIAVSEVGRPTNGSNTRNRNISLQTLDCPECDGQTETILMTANMAMVGLMMNAEGQAESTTHSKQIAKWEMPELEFIVSLGRPFVVPVS